MFEGLYYATHPEVNAQMDREIAVWEHSSARSLMQETFETSLLRPRTALDVSSQILKGPATVQDFSDFIRKDYVTSVTMADTQKRTVLAKKRARLTAPPPVPSPSPNTETRLDRKKRHSKEKKKQQTNTAVTRGYHSDK